MVLTSFLFRLTLSCLSVQLNWGQYKNYPLPAELNEKAWRATKEDLKVKKLLNHFEARAEQKHLADICKVESMAVDIKNQFDDLTPLESLLVDQMAAIHKASMVMLANIYSAEGFELETGEKFINLSSKLMRVFQSGLQTLNQIKNSGKQTIIVKHQNVQVNGGQAIVATEVNTTAGGGE